MKVTKMPIVISALGKLNKELVLGLEDLEVRGRVETTQKTPLLRSAIILRRELETSGDILSPRLQWKTISLPWFEKLSNEQSINKDLWDFYKLITNFWPEDQTLCWLTKKKIKNLPYINFGVPVDHKVKKKENEKIEKYLESTRSLINL